MVPRETFKEEIEACARYCDPNATMPGMMGVGHG
jgi:hypothetical protein